jgi:membrane protein DedA with SNARE-associated domain
VPLVTRLVGEAEVSNARVKMNRYGAWVLLLCRGVPVLAEVTALFAGAMRHPARSFGFLTGLGNLGLAMAYSLVASFRVDGALAFVVPFGFGLAVPGLSLVLWRLLGGGGVRA